MGSKGIVALKEESERKCADSSRRCPTAADAGAAPASCPTLSKSEQESEESKRTALFRRRQSTVSGQGHSFHPSCTLPRRVDVVSSSTHRPLEALCKKQPLAKSSCSSQVEQRMRNCERCGQSCSELCSLANEELDPQDEQAGMGN